MKTTHVKAHSRSAMVNPFTIKHEEMKSAEEPVAETPVVEHQFGAEVIQKTTFKDAKGNKHVVELLKKTKGKGEKAVVTYAATEQIRSPTGKITNKATPLPKVKSDKKAKIGFGVYVNGEKLGAAASVAGKKIAKAASEGAHEVGTYAKKEFGVFKGWLAKKKQQREEQKKVKEEVGTKLETY
jgi:hypothetical protein